MVINRFRGDTKPFQLLLSDSEGPLNLSGCTITLTTNKKSNPTDTTDQVFQLVGSVTSPTNGIVEFSLNSTQADYVGYLYFDIQVVDAQSYVTTLVKGTMSFQQDITK